MAKPHRWPCFAGGPAQPATGPTGSTPGGMCGASGAADPATPPSPRHGLDWLASADRLQPSSWNPALPEFMREESTRERARYAPGSVVNPDVVVAAQRNALLDPNGSAASVTTVV